jgi:hypothetical protein
MRRLYSDEFKGAEKRPAHNDGTKEEPMNQVWLVNGMAAEMTHEFLGRMLKAMVRRLLIFSLFVLAVAMAIFFYGFPIWAFLRTITDLPSSSSELLMPVIWVLSSIVTAVAMTSLPAPPRPAPMEPGPAKQAR